MRNIRLVSAAALAACATLVAGAQSPQQPPASQQSEVTVVINGSPGLPPKYAVPKLDRSEVEALATERRPVEDAKVKLELPPRAPPLLYWTYESEPPGVTPLTMPREDVATSS